MDNWLSKCHDEGDPMGKENHNTDEHTFIPINQYFHNHGDNFLMDIFDDEKRDEWGAINRSSYPFCEKETQGGKYKDVFARLTDTKFYTGMHKERFAEMQKCSGKVTTADHYADGKVVIGMRRKGEEYTQTFTGKRHIRAVVTPGLLGIQKYGIQIARPKNIWLYRNGDRYHNGLLFLVKPYMTNWKWLLTEITNVLVPIIGPVRNVYDQNFKRVKSVEELRDGAKYLCTSGDPPAVIDKLGRFLSRWVTLP
ncbi:apicortin, putative [Plasmodium ovale curtisi]|uniref:Apicortin, putative n=1 Tax=Plasmodium ovale curtisi TaxID=864141 RepID=A0A1A8VYF9_PLAOA|nr:apicortin, putative [Plasmodium ovale curtisi]